MPVLICWQHCRAAATPQAINRKAVKARTCTLFPIFLNDFIVVEDLKLQAISYFKRWLANSCYDQI